MTDKIFNIQWHITDRCNCRCLHCYQSDYTAQAGIGDLYAMLASFDVFFTRQARSGLLTITGGEPLVHPDFWTLLQHLSENFPHIGIAVLSNGTLIDRAAAERLAEYGTRFVQISIEGRGRIHDSIRGAGNYQRAVEGIHHLRRAGIPVSISFTAHAGNYKEITRVARLGRSMDRVKVWSDRMIPDADDQSDEGLAALDPVQTSDYLKRMRAGKNVSMSRALQFLEGGRTYRCTAGASLMAVMPDGTVYPCRRLPIPAGNILTKSLSQIYEEPLMDGLRTGECLECSGCLYKKECNGGLRCLAYACTGDMWKADPGCPVRAGLYRVRTWRWKGERS